MSDKQKENNTFSKDVSEKISTVFQNFAVNPVIENINNGIEKLDAKIFGEEEIETSLKEQMADNASNIRGSINTVKNNIDSSTEQICGEIYDLTNILNGTKQDLENFRKENNEKRDSKSIEICEKINDLTNLLNGAKQDIENFQKENNEKRDSKSIEICEKLGSLIEEINNKTKRSFDDITNQNKKDVNVLIEKISDSEKSLVDTIIARCNDIKDQIQENNQQAQADNQAISKIINENYLQLEKAINNFAQKSLDNLEQSNNKNQNTIEKTKAELLDNMTAKYETIKKIIFGILIANGILVGAAITTILLLIL